METTIITHDIETGKARIRFELDGISEEQDYDLIKVIPGSEYVLPAMNLPFDGELQQRAIDKLISMKLNQFALGMIQPEPPQPLHEYVAPPVAEEAE